MQEPCLTIGLCEALCAVWEKPVMRINILALGPEEQPVPFAGTVDLSYVVRWGEVPFPEPVSVSGTACSKHGQTLVELEAQYTHLRPLPAADGPAGNRPL